MILKDQLLKAHNKNNCDIIVNWVGNHEDRFIQLFECFLTNDYRLAQRASWPLSYCVSAHPELLKNHFGALIKRMKSPSVHNAIKRNGVRLLQDVVIPEKFEGEIIEMCFSFLKSPYEAVAIKAFSMSVIFNLAQKYPELKRELKIAIEDQISHQSAAFKSRGNKILKCLL
ncbi:MAG: hypothetical protein JSS98_05150 [Bacteroidetes bacterium]|nr:hypothetical protein [Bacteroidota bacterium]